MSRIVVIGGSGRTGKLIVEQLVKAGDSVVAAIRNPRQMAAMVKLGAETQLLDLEKSGLDDFVYAMKGAEAVVFAAGAGENEDVAIDRKGVLRTVRAAEKAGVKRYVAISALGASTKVPKDFSSPQMKGYYAAKKAANKHVRNSALKWTIIEPAGLTEGKAKGKVALSEGANVENTPVARADVAAVVVAVLAEPRSEGHVFQVLGGSTAIEAAVKAGVA